MLCQLLLAACAMFDTLDVLQTLRAKHRALSATDTCVTREARRPTELSNRAWFEQQRETLHGGDDAVNWYGHALAGLNTSCHFVSHTVEPTSEALTTLLDQIVYFSPGQSQKQCSDPSNTRWNPARGHDCARNNFGTLYTSYADCLRHSMDIAVNSTRSAGGRQCRGSLCLTRVRYRDAVIPMIERMGKHKLGANIPPAPYLIYGKGAFVGGVGGLHGIDPTVAVDTDGERYTAGCQPYWKTISDQAAHPRHIDGHPGAQPKTIHQVHRICAVSPEECPYPVHDRIMHIAQVYMNALFHFAVEIWPKIAPFLALLQADRHIMLYADTTLDGEYTAMQTKFFNVVGISPDRLLSGHHYAKEVLIPRVGFSHNPMLNFWNLHAMRATIIGADRPRSPPSPRSRPRRRRRTILLLRRDSGRRIDSNLFTDDFVGKLRAAHPQYAVELFAASNATLMGCLPCQIAQVRRASVIVATHGAGLSHLMWAPAGALVIELINKHNSMIYGEMAFMFGQKYLPIDTQTIKGPAQLLHAIGQKIEYAGPPP